MSCEACNWNEWLTNASAESLEACNAPAMPHTHTCSESVEANTFYRKVPQQGGTGGTNVLNTSECTNAVPQNPEYVLIPEIPKGPTTDKDVFDAIRFLTADQIELKDLAIKYLRGKVEELEKENRELRSRLDKPVISVTSDDVKELQEKVMVLENELVTEKYRASAYRALASL